MKSKIVKVIIPLLVIWGAFTGLPGCLFNSGKNVDIHPVAHAEQPATANVKYGVHNLTYIDTPTSATRFWWRYQLFNDLPLTIA